MFFSLHTFCITYYFSFKIQYNNNCIDVQKEKIISGLLKIRIIELMSLNYSSVDTRLLIEGVENIIYINRCVMMI